MLFSTSKIHAQCDIDAKDIRSYQEALQNYEGRIDISGSYYLPNAKYTFPAASHMLLIPNGITFTGEIEGSNYINTAICIQEGASFTPSNMNNFIGTIINFSSVTEITITYAFKGSIENYGGTINIFNNGQLEDYKYILNQQGHINWNSNLNANNGCIYNEDFININGQVSGQGTIKNEAWFTVNDYAGQNNITNNGKFEVLGSSFSFNGGNVVNNCVFYSAAEGTQFQNNTNIYNYGLIYLPDGNFENKSGNIFTNGSTGVVRSKDFTNKGVFTGSGWVFVSDYSQNIHSGSIFGFDGDVIHFYDSSPGGIYGPFDYVSNDSYIGVNVRFTPFPTPFYTPDLSNYQCGQIIQLGSINPGKIAASQILCNGEEIEPFISLEEASISRNGAIITCQWQKSTDNFFFFNIDGATITTFTETSFPSEKTYYRRRSTASFPFPYSIFNSTAMSNVITLTPTDHNPASITINPNNALVCDDEAQFVASAINYDMANWQISIDEGISWENLTDNTQYSGSTEDTLKITNASDLMNGYQYRLMTVNNSCGNVYSTEAALYVATPNVIVETAESIKCPDTDPALEFNGIDSNYQMGNSVITFLVQRNTSDPFNWSFSYQLDISNPELLVDSQSQGNIDITDTNTSTFPLTFYIENQTEEIVSATLSINNVEVAGCSESSEENPNHTAIMQVHKMPLAGEFKKD
jgi:hypothetical protein